MEIIYPDDFISFFNEDDNEIVEVGEFEVRNSDTYKLLEMIDSKFAPYHYRPNPVSHDFHNNIWYDPGPLIVPWFTSNSYCSECADSYRYNDNDKLNESFELSNRGNITESISNLKNKVKNIPGTIYDSFRPPFPPGYSGGSSGGPSGPPPLKIPSKYDKNVKFLNPQTTALSGGATPKAVSPGSISFCLFRFTYIWQTNGKAYWSYLIRVDRQSVSGFRWAGWRWVFFGVDLRRIEAFVC